MERGQILYVQARYIEASQEFLLAYEYQPFSAFLFNAAVAYERFGDGGRGGERTGIRRAVGPACPERSARTTPPRRP